MASSTFYGWAEPDNTDLVTNGALAMRTLGNAIDASVWSVGQGQAGKNKIINGSMAVAQRGTTFSTGSVYTVDRWYADAATTIARDAGTSGIPFSLKITNSTGNPAIRQAIELPATGNAGQFVVGSTWTISYYAKRSTGTSNAAAYIAFNNGLGGGAPTSIFSSTTMGTVTTSWQRFSATFTISASIGGSDNCIAVVPYVASGAFAGDTWFTGVQLEQGSKATPFQTASGNSIQNELAMCQRYYLRITPSAALGRLGVGDCYGTTTAQIGFNFPVTMRIAPTALEQNGTATDYSVRSGAASTVCSAVPTFLTGDPYQSFVTLTVASGLVVGNAAILRPITTGAYLGWSAEL